MKELEILLTSLVEKGRKPFWKERCFKVESVDKNTYEVNCGNIGYRCSLRDLVSLESGLWQFVCENKMVYSSSFIEWQKWGTQWAVLGLLSTYHKYRLIESTLIPEEELGKFLIDNIKVEWPGKN